MRRSADRPEGRIPRPPWRGLLAGVAPALILLVVLGLVADLEAQEPADLAAVDAGAPVTVPVRMAAPPAAADAPPTYRLRAARGIRLFVPERGTAAPVEEDMAVLPVTFVVGQGLAAGVHRAVRVRFRWAGAGGSEPVERDTTIRVRVPARHDLDAELDAPSPAAARGRPLEVTWRVRNRGNAVDTVSLRFGDADGLWRIGVHPRRLVLAPGETASGSVEVEPAPDARVGSSRRLALSAVSPAARADADVRLRVVEDAPWLPGLEHLPARVFVGTTGTVGAGPEGDGEPAGTAGLVASFEAAGVLGDGTEVRLQGRHRPRGTLPRPFRERASGPDVRLDLRHGPWRLEAGNVTAEARPAGTRYLQGRGLDLDWSGASASAELVVARTGRDGRKGLAALARGRIDLGHGTVGLAASRQDRDSDSGRVRMETASLELAAGRNGDARLSARAGLLRARAADGSRARGPVLEGRAELGGDAGHLLVHASRVPGEVQGLPTAGSGLRGSGRLELGGGLQALGRGFRHVTPLVGTPSDPTSAGASAGLRLDRPGIRLEGRARWRESRRSGPSWPRRSRRTVSGQAVFTLGPLDLDGYLELGREEVVTPASDGAEEVVTTEPYRSARAGAQWMGESAWGWISAGVTDRALAPARADVAVRGGLRADPLEFEAGYRRNHAGEIPGDDWRAWGRLAWTLEDDLALVAGAERSPFGLGDGSWTVSLGVEKGLSLPLPLPSTPDVRGVVFEDRDGDGRRDDDEPGLAGIRVRAGWAEAVTDGRGRFEIRAPSVRGEPVEIVATSLPRGTRLPPTAGLSGPEVRVPVVPTADLSLELFVDRDGDGRRGDDEDAARDARVTLVDAAGRPRALRIGADGRVEAGGLLPGAYRLEIHLPGTRRRKPLERTVELELEPGRARSERLALEPEPREIRFR